MPITTKFEALDVQALVATSGPEASQALAAFAAEQIAAAQASNAEALGTVPSYATFVDGARSDSLTRVRPDGTIVAVFDLASDLLQHIWDLLIVAAPFLTGQFKRSITIYADGQEIDSVADVGTATEVVFTSTVPYARKIERGESNQAPEGVFEGVAAIMNGRYGNQAKIRFGYREPVGGGSALARWAGARANGRSRRERAADVRQPAIVVTLR